MNAIIDAENIKDKNRLLKDLKKQINTQYQNPKWFQLNESTKNILLELILAQPSGLVESIDTTEQFHMWLNQQAENQKILEILANLEAKSKRAKLWKRLENATYALGEAWAPLMQTPIIGVVMNPLVNTIQGVSHLCAIVSMGYDPSIGKKSLTKTSRFKKSSAFFGVIATVASLSLLIPPLWPFSFLIAPIAASSLIGSMLSMTGASTNKLWTEFKHGKLDAGKKWRLASYASAIITGLGHVAIAALALTALLTPVGWAAGAGAIAFGIGSAVASLAGFVATKLLLWKSKKVAKKIFKPVEQEAIQPAIPAEEPPTVRPTHPEPDVAQHPEVSEDLSATRHSHLYTPEHDMAHDEPTTRREPSPLPPAETLHDEDSEEESESESEADTKHPHLKK